MPHKELASSDSVADDGELIVEPPDGKAWEVNTIWCEGDTEVYYERDPDQDDTFEGSDLIGMISGPRMGEKITLDGGTGSAGALSRLRLKNVSGAAAALAADGFESANT